MANQPWMEKSDVFPVFPTLIWKIQVAREVYEPLNARILARLDAMLAAVTPGPTESWQSPHGLHKLQEFAQLVTLIDGLAQSVLKFLHIGCDTLQITGCWANVNPKGAAHRMHCHPNNFLSGVYYVEVPPGADTINFHDPRPQTGILRPPVTALTGNNTDQVVVRVANGTLLLFPAWLPHSVDANPGEESRVSVSFNLMFSAFGETLAKPLWGEEDGPG
jgi:uncharacterized protein (TIGR02466 family)